jgi:glycosyltransferase involved in cell wall biosynthesis
MKIALVNNLYYPYNRGGAETFIKQMIADLKAQNHEVFLITSEPRNKKEKIKNTEGAEIRSYHFPSHYYNLATWPNPLKVIWHFSNIFSFAKTTAIKKVLSQEKPDLIITHNLMGLGFLLPQAIKKLKIRHEHYLHDIQLLYPSGLLIWGQEKIIDGLSAKIYQLFTRAFFSSPAKIVSPSRWLLDEHKKRGFFINSEIEVKRTPEENNNNYAADKPAKNFLFVGQIEEHKGILFLIKTFVSVLATKPELKLTIVGDGSLLLEAKKLAESKEQIEFMGRLSPSPIKSLMEKSDCLLIPSLCYENAPMTIYEAHAASLPVLASNIGGIPEIINNHDRLFKPGDALDLKDKIINRK